MTALAAITPIFALIFAGWLVRRFDIVQAQGMTELNRFVVWLALPALMFDVTANARLAEVWQPGFIIAFGASVVVVFALTVVVAIRRRPLADAAVAGLAAAYGNVAFMGYPLAAAVLGNSGVLAATIATLVTICALFATAVALIEAGLQAEARPHHLALKVGRTLLRNPLVVATLLGAVVAVVGLAIPAPIEKALKMLGGTASPCALVTIGLFFGSKSPTPDKTAKGETAETAFLVILKLLVQPLIAFALAKALHLPAIMTRGAVLLAAMPTGTGPFMLAEFYGRDVRVTSKTILITTLVSIVTLSVCIGLPL